MREDIEADIRRTGRTCGDCSMCCKIPPIPEVEKPEFKWCKHCKPGKAGGCTIYQTRPDACRDFACSWLTNDFTYGEEWKPSLSKIVIRSFADGHNTICQFMVDPSVPQRWREQPYYETIKRVAFNGLNATGGLQFQTYVRVSKSRSFFILPTEDFETRDDQFVMAFKTGDTPRDWKARQFETPEQAKQFGDEMDRRALARRLQQSV